MNIRFLGLLALAAAITSAAPASATVIFDSLGNSQDGTGGVHNTLGASFSTGGAAVALTDVKLELTTTSQDGISFGVYLAADSSTSVGTYLDLLGTINDSSLPISPTAVTVDVPVPSISLAADTRYWIVLDGSNNPSARWEYSNSNTGVGVPNEYYSDGGVFPNSEGPYLMRVTVASTTPAPEPASLALLGAGLVGIVAARRRK